MAKLNLFKKIFEKNLHKGKEPLTKFVDDVGPLKGMFSFKGIDIRTGLVVSEFTSQNMIVNQSKSSIIRLLGQGQSTNAGTINPEDYKISKMRFSNDLGTGGQGFTGPDKLEYYSLTESSHRASYGSNSLYAGGVRGNATLLPPTNPSNENYRHDFEDEYTNNPVDYQAVSGGKEFSFKSGQRPPSHASVVVKFVKDFSDGNGEQIIEEHFFDYQVETTDIDMIYTRDKYSNVPNRIINYATEDGDFIYISTPVLTPADYVEETVGGKLQRTRTIESSGDKFTGTRLYYDYTTGSEGWKFYIEENQLNDAEIQTLTGDSISYSGVGTNPEISNNIYDKIQISFTVGFHNVINLIIPKFGENLGYGNTLAIRYPDGGSSGDAYSVGSIPTYVDCADDFIDDYAVTFTTSMGPNEGNGVNWSGADDDYLKYTKAYLFSENDEMFSSINFSSDFNKNENLSYQISWKILAPVE